MFPTDIFFRITSCVQHPFPNEQLKYNQHESNALICSQMPYCNFSVDAKKSSLPDRGFRSIATRERVAYKQYVTFHLNERLFFEASEDVVESADARAEKNFTIAS